MIDSLCCCSSKQKKPTTQTSNEESAGRPSVLPTSTANKTSQDSTVALINAILPSIIPVVCKVVGQSLIADPETTILKHEKKVEHFDKFAPASEQVLSDLHLQMSKICIVDADTVLKDMENMPSFAWPGKGNVRELMRDNSNGVSSSIVNITQDQMTVVDIVDFNVKIMLGKGIEFAIPVESPISKKMMLEIGCGGEIGDDAWFQLQIPKLRVWVVGGVERTETDIKRNMKCYVAFFGRPNLTPHVHINADMGRGDFFEIVLDETGSIDDVVESVLMGFGPKEYQDESTKNNTSAQKERGALGKTKQSWIGNALGKYLSKALGTFMGMGNNRPYEVDLSEIVTDVIDVAMGKPRPVEAVEADLEILQKELERSKQYVKEQEENEKKLTEEAPKTSRSNKTEDDDDENNIMDNLANCCK